MALRRRTVLAGGTGVLAGTTGGLSERSRLWPESESEAVRIGFIGDVMLGRSVTEHWQGKPAAGVWGSTLRRLRSLDGLLLNLECAITDRGNPWPEKVFSFRADPDFATQALRSADASVASLANNHVLDYRSRGLQDTRRYLDRAGIAHTGAGTDRFAAFAPAVFEAAGLTVATLGFTGREPAYEAGNDTAGTAFLPLSTDLATARSRAQASLARARRLEPDLLVVSVHFGPNWETAPSDRQTAFARWLVEQGVDVVHGHSAHVFQGVEQYRDGVILYDTGDFVDDYISYRQREGVFNKRSGLFTLTITDGNLTRLRVDPIEISDETARTADPTVARWVCRTLRARSAPYGTAVDHADGVAIVSL